MGNSLSAAIANKLPVLPDSSCPGWHPDTENCERCNTPFTLTNRRHHCRWESCGACVCGDCSKVYKVKLPLRTSSDIRSCHYCKVYQIDSLMRLRNAEFGFQIAEGFADFLKVAYSKYDDKKDGVVDGGAGLLPTDDQTLVDGETLKILKEKGGKCQEDLIWLFDDQPGFTNKYCLLCPRTEATISALTSKDMILGGDEKNTVFSLRCQHYFVLTKRGANVALKSVDFSNSLTSKVQFNSNNREIHEWFLRTLAYTLSGVADDDKEDKNRQKMIYTSFIHRNALISCADIISLSSNNNNSGGGNDDDDNDENKNKIEKSNKEMFSWMLLCLFKLGQNTNPFDLKSFPYSEDDDQGKGNLKVKIGKLWKKYETVVGEQEKKWYKFVESIKEWKADA